MFGAFVKISSPLKVREKYTSVIYFKENFMLEAMFELKFV